jgi:hypothetical protein
MNAKLLCSIVATSLTLAACSKSDEAPPAEKTRAQKDSAIANSSLPGAGTVGSAMKVADSAKARQAALDSASKP